MIKRLWFAPAPWVGSLDVPGGAARPLRVTVSTAIPDLEASPPWAEVGEASFTDLAHLERFASVVDAAPPDVAVLDVDELVVRGAEWLERRWAHGRPRLKHLAVATRHPSLDRATFASRWRDHAGSVGTTPIPEIARGQAYVQDHPLADATADPCYDAVTEVWFDAEAGLRTRIAWMDDALAASPPDDLFGSSWRFAVREELLTLP